MDQLREFEEEVEIVEEESPEVHKSVFTDASRTADGGRGRDRGRGRGKVRETGGVISASLGAMLPLIGKLDMLLLAPAQGSYSKRVMDGMRLLKDDVEKIRSYLDKLSEVEDPPPTAKCWMNEARDLSYKMEDYIDSLLSVQPADPYVVGDNIKATRSLRKWFTHLETPPKAKGHEQVVRVISELRMYVQEAIQRREVYVLSDSKIKSTLRCRFVSVGPMIPMPYDDETSDIVIDGRMNEFINSMANDGDQQLKVISVLGSACLGKTTLAKMLCNKFGKRYHCRAFIRVSKKPDMKRIFHDMLSQLQQGHPPQDCKEVSLTDRIREYLQNKRYLIIIDDLCAASVWNIINHALPKGSNGSRIITTTQLEDVALTCSCHQSECVFEMKPLDEGHSRRLFFNRLFGSESCCPEHFEEVLNEIVEICGGLPLATISIASLLASQPVMTIDLLKYIHQSLSSCFVANSTSDRTRQALILCFNNLPPYLKTCLLYFSMYPEGYKFCKADLVKQWIAEGFIGTTEGQDMEEVAGSYLDELIGRKFIQPILINYNNEVLSCAVHDLVHDLIAQKSAEENFIVARDYSQKNVALPNKVRRLSLFFDDARYVKTPENIRTPQVRSFAYSGLYGCMPCISEFKLLRVLNLQLPVHGGYQEFGGYDNPVDLNGISELFQLRYLKIACDLGIKLPNYMGGLQCLETLDLDAVVLNFACDIHLLNLLHLHLSLPAERNLLESIGSMWSGSLRSFGKLNYLQDLHLTISSTPPSDHLKSFMEALGSLIGGHGNLKNIVVDHDSLVKNIIVCVASKLSISWYSVAPPPLLQRFEFTPHSRTIFSQIPPWVEKHANLRILKIAVRELRFYCVDTLGELPALTALSLCVEKAPNYKIIFDRAWFPVLKYFKLSCGSGIAWLKFETDAMPNLWKLKLVFNAIPPVEQALFYFSRQVQQHERHQHGTPIISIEHMPCVREISAKFRGAAADLDYALRTVVSNHPSNPTINMQSYKIVEGEQSDWNPEEDSDEHGNTLERPADKRISRSSESSWHLNIPRNLHLSSLPMSSTRFQGSQTVEESEYPPEWVGQHEFTLDELVSATSNFSKEKIIGMSGFGCIYKGIINANLIVAIKYPDDYFLTNELLPSAQYLDAIRHPHLVSLLGYCQQGEHCVLVYEYMPNGSLKSHLLNNLLGSLTWLKRLKIAVEAAKGLASVHKLGMPMFYGGFTASSILFDSDYTVKLWGFGLAKQKAVKSKTPAILTTESDVYNFGVVLLELLAGRPSVDMLRMRLSRKRNLAKWSRPYLCHADKLHRIMDPNLEGQYPVSAAWTTATIARQCLHSVPNMRPTIHDVLNTLESVAFGNDDEEK